MVLGTGLPSSSVIVPATMMRSPSAGSPVAMVRSASGGKRPAEKLGPVVSVIVCGSGCSLCFGCRLIVPR